MKLGMAAQIVLLTVASGVLTVAWAKEPVAPVNAARDATALKGYDTVAYFRESKPVKGKPEFSFTWNGAKWLFDSAGNRDAFVSDPEKYAPQFGGYCAWAVGHAYTADADPEAWKIVDGKLYLNYNKSVQEKWLQDSQKWIESGSKNWPTLHK